MPHSPEVCSTVTVEDNSPPDAKEGQAKPAHHANGRFKNPWESFGGVSFNLRVALDMRREMNANPLPDPLPPVHKPDWGHPADRTPEALQAWGKDIKTTWLGHASFLLELPAPNASTKDGEAPRGVRILFDPVYSHRVGPTSWLGSARFQPPAVQAAETPPVDLILISHNHYDHMDLPTLTALQKQQPQGSPYFLVPLGNASWIRHNVSAPATQVQELDWWQSRDVTVDLPGGAKSHFRATFVPAQHMTKRGLFDDFKTLWGGWVIEPLENGVATSKIYFAGDTAYRHVPDGAEDAKMPHCPAFKEMGAKFGGFDLSMIPIGAYSPRGFMSNVHVNPEEAVEIHFDVKSKKTVAMHYGTFRLTGEDILEPPKRLAAAMKAKAAPDDEFVTLEIGKTLRRTPPAPAA